jgi:hypothetical protein
MYEHLRTLLPLFGQKINNDISLFFLSFFFFKFLFFFTYLVSLIFKLIGLRGNPNVQIFIVIYLVKYNYFN